MTQSVVEYYITKAEQVWHSKKVHVIYEKNGNISVEFKYELFIFLKCIF